MNFYIDFLNNKNIKKYLIVTMLFILLLLPNLYTLFYSHEMQKDFFLKFYYLLFSIFLWWFLLALIGNKFLFYLGWLPLLFSPIEIGFVRDVGMSISEGLIEALLSTDFNEAKEQITSNIGLLVVFFVICILYGYFLFRLGNFKMNKNWRLLIISLFFILNLGLVIKIYFVPYNALSFFDRIENSFQQAFQKYKKIYPINVFISGNNLYQIDLERKKMEKGISMFSFQAKQKKKNSEPEIYVLVIGETARYYNFHLNGYKRETTPELEKLNNFISFSNVYSSSNLTSISVPQIITRANPENYNLQFKEKSIVDAFHEAGFYTAWIGNQSRLNPTINRLKDVVDYSYFTISELDGSDNFDNNLINQLRKVLRNPQKKKFIVIHSLGSHFRYSNRYPKNFESFKPNIDPIGYDNINVENKQKFINSYDNSILYTDYFLSNVIKEINQPNNISAMIYLSDHGENLFDDGATVLHGTANPTKYEYHIPYFVWLSENYIHENPEQYENLIRNKNKKISSTSTFYTMLDMANIEYKNFQKEIHKSISSPSYSEPSKRTILNAEKKIIILPN